MDLDYPSYTAIFFMHIPKCAGTFLYNILAEQKEICFEYAGHEGWNEHGGPLEMNIVKTKLCGKLKSSTRKALRISTVRNPFDLLVSLYFHGGNNPARGFMDVQSAMKFKSFEDFVIWYCDPNSRYNWQFDDFLFSRIFSKEKKCFPEILIRTEYFTSGVQKLFKNLNIQMPETQNLDQNISKTRKGKNYQSLYSSKAREAVELMCYKELDLFGYDFYGPTDNRDLIYPRLDEKLDPKYSKLLFDLWPLYKSSKEKMTYG